MWAFIIVPALVCTLPLSHGMATQVGPQPQPQQQPAPSLSMNSYRQVVQKLLVYIAQRAYNIEVLYRMKEDNITRNQQELARAIDINQRATENKLNLLAMLLDFKPKPRPPIGVTPPETETETETTQSPIGVRPPPPATTTPAPAPTPPPAVEVSGCIDYRVKISGVYTMTNGLNAYCDVSNGGGWTVIQRRTNGETNFYRNWEAYKEGFGDLNGEFYYGNENIYSLTKGPMLYRLRVDMLDFEGNYGYAEYEEFTIMDESAGYAMQMENYHGTAFDALEAHEGMPFSTYDRGPNKDCARSHKGAFWYARAPRCGQANLNGPYRQPSGPRAEIEPFEPQEEQPEGPFGHFNNNNNNRGVQTPFGSIHNVVDVNLLQDNIFWHPWFRDNRPLKSVEMKYRPLVIGQ